MATAAVLKADAYGLGAETVGPALRAAGVRSFFVALAEEGAALRRAVGSGPEIFILSGPMPGDAPLLRAHDLIPCLNSASQIREFAREFPGGAAAIQVDSGMNRLGLEAAELAEVAPLLQAIRPTLVLNHLACADEHGHPLNAAQHEAFAAIARAVPTARRSLAATGGILLGPDFHFELTRAGVGLYGGHPFAAARPVLRLALPVIQVRDVDPGEVVGYGGAWRAERPTRVATLAAGYADGLLRNLGFGEVRLFAGRHACPMIGRVSMDLLTVDVTDLPEVPERLEILNEHQTVNQLATAAGTIGYEILTSLGARYERVYKSSAPVPDPE